MLMYMNIGFSEGGKISSLKAAISDWLSLRTGGKVLSSILADGLLGALFFCPV
jgi:hypothetical protein